QPPQQAHLHIPTDKHRTAHTGTHETQPTTITGSAAATAAHCAQRTPMPNEHRCLVRLTESPILRPWRHAGVFRLRGSDRGPQTRWRPDMGQVSGDAYLLSRRRFLRGVGAAGVGGLAGMGLRPSPARADDRTAASMLDDAEAAGARTRLVLLGVAG